ncbi:transcriptional regulator, MarR family with acetyltransferase activity [Clostridium sp. ASBs410]|nr:transcriptional regulator, MarR family with acetyltransferase activity [Clostridium sp. ASBs410]
MQRKLKCYVGIIRNFNRYYTNVLGLFNQHILESSFSLSEVRILHEIEKIENYTAKMLADTLSIDVGYLSRILKRFQKYGFIEKKQSPNDWRAQYLTVTPIGKKKMDKLNAISDEQIAQMLKSLSDIDIVNLVRNMTSIESILTNGKNIKLEDISIRTDVRAGDAGYITYMHGWIYREEYDYSTAFEGYVTESFYEFLLDYTPDRDRLWCAEYIGEIIGCIGIVGHEDKAQLRWFLLHPNYRGIGLGKKLLNLALAFAREKGYKKVYLSTTNDLEKAISMYTKAGFVKSVEKENRSWRDDLTELEYEMYLE